MEWKNRNRARATNPFVASQKSIFALVSELLKYLNMDNRERNIYYKVVIGQKIIGCRQLPVEPGPSLVSCSRSRPRCLS